MLSPTIRSRSGSVAVIVALTAALCSATVVAIEPTPDDHPDTAAATRSPQDSLPNASGLGGGLDFPGDVDFLSFQGVAGASVNLHLQAEFAARFTVFDQNGLRILASRESGSPGSLDVDHLPILTSGTYYVSVAHYSGSGRGNYSVDVHQVTPDLRAVSAGCPAAATLLEPLAVTAAAFFSTVPSSPRPIAARARFLLLPQGASDPALGTAIGEATAGSVYSPMSPQQTLAFTGSFTLADATPKLQAGTYRLGVLLDPEGVLQESDERNNFVLAPGPVVLTSPSLDVVAASFQVLGGTSLSASGLLPVTYSVSLTGGSGNIPPYNVNSAFYLSSDGVLDSADLQLETDSLRLAPGQTLGRRVDLVIPAGAVPGTYSLFLRANGNNPIPDASSSNNVLQAGTVTVGARAIDLAILGGGASVSTISLDGRVPVTLSVRYTAPSSSYASLSFSTLVFLTSDAQGRNRISSSPGGTAYFNLDPNTSGEQSADLTPPPAAGPGTYYIAFQLQTSPEPGEVTSTNNLLVLPQPITVTASTLDLQLASFSAAVTSVSVYGRVPLTATLSLVAQGQAGGAMSRQAHLQFFLIDPSGQRVEDGRTTYYVYPVPGTPYTVEYDFRISRSLAPGLYTLVALADPDRLFPDGDRQNNQRTLTVQVIATDIDLSVEGLRALVPNLALGESLPVTAAVRYSAPHPSYQEVSSRLRTYLSLDRTLERLSDPRLGADTSVSLQAQGALEVRMDPVLPATLPPGAYYLIAEVDPENTTTETREDNNVFVSAGALGVGPEQTDLVLSGVQAQRASFSPLEAMPITATVSYLAPSIGFPAADTRVAAYLSADTVFDAAADLLLGETQLLLRPGQTTSLQLRGVLRERAPAGTYYVICLLDPDGTVADSDRTNNRLVNLSPVTVGPPQANLAATGLTFSPASVQVNGMLTAEATYSFTVPEAARFDPVSFQGELYLLPEKSFDPWTARRLSYETVSLAPNGMGAVSKNLSLSNQYPAIVPGVYYLAAAVDRPQALAETNELDNLFIAPVPITLTAAVYPSVELSLGPLSATTPSVRAGSTLSVPWSLTASSPANATQYLLTYLRYYLSETASISASRGRYIGYQYVYELPGGQTTTGTASLTLAHSLPAGNYYLVAEATPQSATDSDLADNVRISSQPLAVLPPAANRAPVADAGGDRLVASGRNVTLYGSVQEPDGDPSTYLWAPLSGATVTYTGATTACYLQFMPPAAGSYRFRFTATDLFGLTSTSDVTVTVVDPAGLGPIVDTAVGPARASNRLEEGTPADGTVVTGPDDVALDSTAYLYYLESSQGRLRRVSSDTRLVHTVAGTPPTAQSSSSDVGSPGAGSHEGTGSYLLPTAAGVLESRYGVAGFAGDGGLPADARFAFPQGISIGSGGAVLVADTFNHRIRRVVAGSQVDTVAGGAQADAFGAGGHAGDGGSPLQAALNRPAHAVQAANGDVYIADTGNRVIRKVSGNAIGTFAGTGFPGSTGDGGRASEATFVSPARLALDTQNHLFVIDSGAHRVRRIDLATQLITTVIGTGQAGFSGDGGLATLAQLREPAGGGIDGLGNGYLCDTGNHRLRRVDRSTEVISTLAGTGGSGFSGDGGPAAKAQLTAPRGLAIDGQRNLFFADDSGRVRVVGASVQAAPEAPAIVLLPGQPLGSFSQANDGDAVTAGIQARVVYDLTGASLPATLGRVELLVSGGGASVVYTGDVFGQSVVFTAVALVHGTSYLFTLREPGSTDVLMRHAVTEGRAPTAVVRATVNLLAGPQVVRLDGSGSSDPDAGDSLTYRWSILQQPASSPVLTEAQTQAPALVYKALRSGLYVFRLLVTDTTGRTDSDDTRFQIVNVPPQADAGSDRQFLLPSPGSGIPLDRTTTVAFLDGRGSSDANADPVFYSWALVRRPQAAVGVAERTTSPVIFGETGPVALVQFSQDLDGQGTLLDAGLYEFALTVSDPLGASNTRTVRVLALDPKNVIPNANAGVDRVVAVTRRSASPTDLATDIPDVLGLGPVSFVRLDGRESADSPMPGRAPRPLNYHWTVASAPAGSNVTSPPFPLGASTALPAFVPDQPGVYTFELVVDNGVFASAPDRVDVRVIVRNLNAPPTADFRVTDPARGRASTLQSPILTFAVDDLVTLDGTYSSDRDDPNRLSYEWTQLAGESVALAPSTTDSRPSFTPTTPGVYEFQLSAIDPKGARGLPAKGRLLVLAAGQHVPRLSLSATATSTTQVGVDFGDELTEGTTASLSATILSTITLTATVVDPEVSLGQRHLTYVFRQLAGPTVAMTTGAVDTVALSSQVQFVPTTSRVLLFEGKVLKLYPDGRSTGIESVRYLRVRVDSPTNGVPVASARVKTGKTVIGLCESVTLDGSGSHDQGANATGSVEYRWTQVAGPQVVLSDPFSAQTTFVVPDVGADGPRELWFALIVDDGHDQSDPNQLNLVIDPTAPQNALLGLGRGLDLVSLPVVPRTTPTYTAADLAALTSSSVVIGMSTGSDGGTAFRPWTAGLGEPFPIEGNQGYLVVRRQPALALPVSGPAWGGAALQRSLGRGTNLVSYPRGVPDGETAESLLARAGASYLVRVNPDTGRFEVFLPGLTPAPFPIEPGRAYILSAPSSGVLTLPTCGQ